MARMTESDFPEYLANLQIFCKIAKYIAGGEITSYRKIVERVNVDDIEGIYRFKKFTLHTLTDTIDWLERHYGVRLIDRTRGSGDNGLTTEGRQLYINGSALIETIGNSHLISQPGELRVAASRLVLHSVIPEIVREALSEAIDSQTKVAIESTDFLLEAKFDDGYEIKDCIDRLAANSLDIALLWASEDRRRRVQEARPQLRFEELHKFQLLCVYPFDHVFAPRREVDVRDIAAETVYIMDREHQPAAVDRLLRKGEDEGCKYPGPRVPLPDYSSMISRIRARQSGIALIPDIMYKELDRLRKAGELCYSSIAGSNEESYKITLAAIYRGTNDREQLSAAARSFLLNVENYLDKIPKKSGWDIDIRPFDLPAPLDGTWIAYYLNSRDAGRVVPTWQRAFIELNTDHDINFFEDKSSTEFNKKSNSFLTGRMEPIGLPAYRLYWQRFGTTLLIKADPTVLRSEEKQGGGHHCIVVINTIIDNVKPDDGAPFSCLVGLWVGRDAKGPAAGPFIMAKREIPTTNKNKATRGDDEIVDLNGIARIAMLRALMSPKAK